MENEAPIDNSNYINVLSPSGEIGSVPPDQLGKYLNSSYKQLSPEELQQHLDQQKNESLPEQAKAFGEGLAGPASFGTFPALERKLGAKPEDIQRRRETGAFKVGELGSLIGSNFIPGFGEAADLEEAANVAKAAVKAGTKTAEEATPVIQAGKEAINPLSIQSVLSGTAERGVRALQIENPIGSMAVKGAIENGLFQSQDEISKMLSGATDNDPRIALQTAVTNIGLSGVLGGAFGAGFGSISPLWKAAEGTKLAKLLGTVQEKLGGSTAETDAVDALTKATGLDLAPEVKSALSGNEIAQEQASSLLSSLTGPAEKFKAALSETKSALGDGIMKAFGKTPEEVGALSDTFSKAEYGKQLGHSIAEGFKEGADPNLEVWDEITGHLKDTELQKADISNLQTKIQEMANERKLSQSPGSESNKYVNRVLKELPLKTDVDSLKAVQTEIFNETKFGSGRESLRGPLINIFRNAEFDILQREASAAHPELADTLSMARTAYQDIREIQSEIADRLPLKGEGRASPRVFVKALAKMAEKDPETLISKLDGKGDATWLNFLEQKFPEAAETLRRYHVDSLLNTAVNKAKVGETMNAKMLLSHLEGMPQELRKFIAPPETMKQVAAVSELLDKISSIKNSNPSGTAPTLVDKVLRAMPATAMGAVAFALGHNPALAALIGEAGYYLTRTAPDAIRLGLLKFLGSSGPIDSEGFKAAVDFITHVQKGESLINKTVKGIFKGAQEVLPQQIMPSEQDIEKLDKHLKQLETNTGPLINLGGKTSHYLPEQGAAMGMMGMNAVQYLNSLRPKPVKQNTFDTETKPSKMQKAQFDRVLTIAEQPLSIFHYLKKGTMTADDVTHLKMLQPALFPKLQQKVTGELIDSMHRGEKVPYALRMGLSSFLGVPLDSTMTPQSLQMIQAQFLTGPTPMQQQQQGGRQHSPYKHSNASLNKLAPMDMTPSQSRASYRSKY